MKNSTSKRTSNKMTFGIIGHQDNWSKIENFVNTLRASEGLKPLPLDVIKVQYPYAVPNKLFDIEMYSPLVGSVQGFYVESFISPDQLNAGNLHKNINKVKLACATATDADVVSLGGFTSILLEAGDQNISYIDDTAFTTGNTLTAAFICDGVEKACKLWGKNLSDSRLLIIGSTGDIGSACVDYFKGTVKELLLGARQPGPLNRQLNALTEKNYRARNSTNFNDLLSDADIVICVASSLLDNCDLSLLSPSAIICDAGYPKNLGSSPELKGRRVFFGGMGIVEGGFTMSPGFDNGYYEFPIKNISHGCLLESIVLAMENDPVCYSFGRGNITKKAMKKILKMAARHSIFTAPLFNEKQCLEQSKNYSVNAF